MQPKKQYKSPAGYTIIELLFAVINFSFVMMIALSAFVVVMRVYNKSAFMRQTQQISRTAIDRMSNEIRLAKIHDIDTGGGRICLNVRSDSVNSVRYARVSVTPPSTGHKIIREAYIDPNCTGVPTVENVTPDSFDVTNLFFTQLVENAGIFIDGVPKSGTGVMIDLTVAKGTVSTDINDPFYNATTLFTFVNARDGSD